MEQKKKKKHGPKRTTVAASAVGLCALLVGVSYFLGGDSQPIAAEPSRPAISPLQSILDRCEERSTEDLGNSRTRTRCTVEEHPAFMLEIIGHSGKLEAISMLVPTGGTPDRARERTQLGLEMFSAIAGAQADTFLSKEYIDAIGTSQTNMVFQNRLYRTQPVANAGVVFAVTPPNFSLESEN